MSFWENIRYWLTNPLFAGPFGGGIVVLLAYLDSKFRQEERENETYWKLFIVSSLIIATLVYLISEEFSKTDEFLNQNYETEIPQLVPSNRGGYTSKHSYQPELHGPKENITKMMENLTPNEVSIVTPELTPKKAKKSTKHYYSKRKTYRRSR